ncbi:hypothetical protein WDJ51_15070 [Rathayibacter sp. YIM 133350]|uniref:hypothetical protein n=1 Tax=Rathayibacter sp. YIM 133350 TaxID=3131992 RepID=UPI00307F475A
MSTNDDITRPADASAPLDDEELTRKDRSYSPASETETGLRQNEPFDTGEAEPGDPVVRAAPGTGGPDDAGDIEVDPADLNMPGAPR